MPYLWLPVGIALPTLCGWLMIAVLERNTPVLSRYERIVAGFFLGGTLLMYVTFLAHIAGLVAFTVTGFASVQMVLTIMLGILCWKTKKLRAISGELKAQSSKLTPFQTMLIATFGIWLLLKLASSFFLLAGPAYFDDTVNNWNMRAKSYVEMQELVIEIEPGKGVGVGSYPPTVPMLKAWLTLLNGQWHEGLANSLHLLWYASALLLVFFSIRRIAGTHWGMIGAYALSSIPLYTMHGTAAYGDLFLSVHVFLAVSFALHAVRSSVTERPVFLKLGALAAGLLIFTKNEALLLHLPPLLFALGIALAVLKLRGVMTMRELRSAVLWYGTCIALVLVPWVLFKWFHNLEFGNAKGISGLELSWHKGVLQSIWVNTFMEGNWSLLPGLLLAFMLLRFRDITRTYAGVAAAFLGMVILGQLPIYMLTPIATEALNQTGYARGLLHLTPVAVLLAVLLMRNWMKSEK